jgi:hypothetical protein
MRRPPGSMLPQTFLMSATQAPTPPDAAIAPDMKRNDKVALIDKIFSTWLSPILTFSCFLAQPECYPICDPTTIRKHNVLFGALRSTSGGPGAKTLEIEQVERGSIEGQAQWRRPSAQKQKGLARRTARALIVQPPLWTQPPSATRRAPEHIHCMARQVGMSVPACLTPTGRLEKRTLGADAAPPSSMKFNRYGSLL